MVLLAYMNCKALPTAKCFSMAAEPDIVFLAFSEPNSFLIYDCSPSAFSVYKFVMTVQLRPVPIQGTNVSGLLMVPDMSATHFVATSDASHTTPMDEPTLPRPTPLF